MRLDGSTPLYVASAEGHLQLVALLLENRANPNAGEPAKSGEATEVAVVAALKAVWEW